jgi:hypothetical protein
MPGERAVHGGRPESTPLRRKSRGENLGSDPETGPSGYLPYPQQGPFPSLRHSAEEKSDVAQTVAVTVPGTSPLW